MTAKLMMIIPTLVQGGAEKQMSLLAAGLPKEEFDVSVCVLTHSGPWEEFLRDHHIPVTVIGKRFKADVIAAGRLFRHLRKSKPDLVHTWIFAANSYGRIAAKLAGVKHIIAGERCVDLWKTEKHFWLDRKLANHTNAIVTNSSGVVDFYSEHGIQPEKFRVIPNGISVDAFENVNADQKLTIKLQAKKRWCQKLQIPETATVLVSLARLWPQKKLKDVIWSLDLLNCTQEDVHLIIAGEGPEQSALREFAQQTKTASHVHFVGHLTSPSELLSAADFFVLGSEYEGQSNALMEAILHRVPAVVSDIPGNRDLIPDSKYGSIFRVGDRAEIAKSIIENLSDPNATRSRAELAFQRLLRDFSLTSMIDRYAALYRCIINPPTQ